MKMSVAITGLHAASWNNKVTAMERAAAISARRRVAAVTARDARRLSLGRAVATTRPSDGGTITRGRTSLFDQGEAS